jgi:hypothetical protein
LTFKATNSHVRIAIPLSKLRVAPDGSHPTLHSPANAHPLKVVTGKRNLLILDFGDAQALRREGSAGYASEQDYADAGAHLRMTLTRWVRARRELYEARSPGQQLSAITFLVGQLGADRAPWLSEPTLRAHLLEWNREFAQAPDDQRHRERWASAFLAIVDLMIQDGTSITGCPLGLAQAGVVDFADGIAPWITEPRRALFRGAELEAARLFLLLLRSPYWVGECKNCGRWFLNTSGQARQSHSRRCAQQLVNRRHNPEAKKELKAKRDAVRDEKLERVHAAIAEYKKRGAGDWKTWVSLRASKRKGPRITKNFLTYAVRDELLKPPKEKT